MKRAGFAAIIGRPNVGKSTLMNHFIGMKLAITSKRPQTTRKRMQTVYTDERGQIVFFDTPGIHKAKNKLGEYMDRAAYKSIADADCAVWLVEPVPRLTNGEQVIREALFKSKAPVILAINKTDQVKNEALGAVIDTYKDLLPFEAIVPVSAKHGDGRDELLAKIFNLMPYGEPFYDEDTVTDETERALCSELIREQLLRRLGEEIPHGTAVVIEEMKEEKRLCRIYATLYCEKPSHKGIIIGKNGAKLKEIGSAARVPMEELLGKKVMLELWVKVKKDWRGDERLMRAMGYRMDDVK